MISVILVEDHEDSLMLLQALLDNAEGLICAGTAANGTQAIKMISDLKPDVVLMDIGLPDINGIECVRQLKPRCPGTEFIMCTAFDEDEKVFESLQAGASSYLLKKSSSEFILNTIREVREGGSPMSSDIARKMIRVLQQKNTRPDFGITKKEGEVLNLLSKGHTYQEVADQLYISIKTLKSHIYRMYEKLQVDNRTEAVNKYFGRSA